MKKDFQTQFNTAYEQLSLPMYRFCLRKVSDCELAKDILQETFLRAWKYAIKGENVLNMRSFLYKILNNLIIDQYRRRPNDESLDTMYEDGFDAGEDETDRLIDSIDGTRVVQFLEKIREPYRTTIRLRYMQQLSIPEISGISNVRENSVVVRIHRGLRILRDRVNLVESQGAHV